MSEAVRIERRLRLEKFLDKVECTPPPPHLIGRWTRTLLDLYIGHLRTEDSEWPNSSLTLNEVFRERGDNLLHMYVHGPIQRRIDEVLTLLREGNHDAVKRVLESIASEQGGKAIASEIQSHNSSHKHKKHPYEKLLDELFKANPEIGHRELEKELLKRAGGGIIHHIDKSLGEIVLNDGRTFRLSGLKDQIYKRRKSL